MNAKAVKAEMSDWYGVNVSEERAQEFLDKNNGIFDTVEREDFVNEIAMELTGMNWPMNGDSQEYKDKFLSKLKEAKK